MKVIRPSYDLTFFRPESGVTQTQFMEKVVRTCYRSEDLIDDGTDVKLLRKIRKRGHLAMFEFGWFAAHITADRGFCYDDQTEVLTEDGWKMFSNLSDSDRFLTMNPDTREMEYQDRVGTTVEDWDGEMIYGKSSMVDFAVTPNHRMFWYHYDARNKSWKINRADEVYGRRVKFMRGAFRPMRARFTDNDLDTMYPQLSNLDFARFLGFFCADGTLWRGEKDGVRKTGGRVSIVQTKEAGRLYIKDVMDRLGWRYSENKSGYVINSTVLHDFLRKFFPRSEQKTYSGRVPRFVRFASPEYINCFLDGMIHGDGSVHKGNGHVVVYTASYKMAGDLQELFMKGGLCSTVRVDDRRGEEREISPGVVIKNNVVQYVVSVTKRTNEHLFNKRHWSRGHYKGKVYCVTVPNGILYVRRNGKAFWCGNTHEMVRHRLGSFAQESTRYCNYSKDRHDGEITCFQEGLSDSHSVQILTDIQERCEVAYLALLQAGNRPEIARAALPISLKAEIWVAANFREWRHIFRMRCDKAAHPMMRTVMHPLFQDAYEKYPVIFEDQAEFFLA